MFSKTSEAGVKHQKVLLYAHHGWGKTYQCRYFEKQYGKGLIISGESGLISLSDCEIDVVEFSSWDGAHDPDKGVFSFKGICRMIASPAFAAEGYKWLAIDSLTELSDRCMEEVEKGFKDPGDMRKWSEFSRQFKGALKWVRDLPYHVYITCLTKSVRNANDEIEYWPAVAQQAVAENLPAMFDHVFCGVRQTRSDPTSGKVTVIRQLITDEVHGWHGKARDPRNRLKPVEEGASVVDLIERVGGPDPALISAAMMTLAAISKTKEEEL